jgi:L-threonylcarbamoyladenylate synthase
MLEPRSTKVYNVKNKLQARKILQKAGEVIREGGLVCFPTETVYGLGADAFND